MVMLGRSRLVDYMVFDFLFSGKHTPAPLSEPRNIRAASVTSVASNRVAIRWQWETPEHLGPDATAITAYEVQERAWSSGIASPWRATGYSGNDLFLVNNIAESDDLYQIRVRATNNADTPVTSNWAESQRTEARVRAGRAREYGHNYDHRQYA